MLTIERVALLRHVPLFSQTPDRVLAGLVRVLEEVEVPAGAQVMVEGDVEDWLFVIEHGELEVVRSDRRVTLGPGSVVGELAVLDPQPRSATILALSPARLLKLHKAAFDDVLRSRPEVAAGVIAELVRRVRERHDPVS